MEHQNPRHVPVGIQWSGYSAPLHDGSVIATLSVTPRRVVCFEIVAQTEHEQSNMRVSDEENKHFLLNQKSAQVYDWVSGLVLRQAAVAGRALF